MLFAGLSINIQPAKGIVVYTAHVKWKGYNFLTDTNCGDGTDQTCENKLMVKRTTSSSCGSRSWIEGSYKNNSPEGIYTGGYYELTWARSGGAPCLTFDVKIKENSAGDSTTQHTYTIDSGESVTVSDMNLVLGTANGDFTIEYKLTIVDYPYNGPSQ
ncbi:MAG: hypothetical protein GPJ54_01880 [Candidatus Heimdallarchaeota archaeon]|nr:hypothetical protein [Candidatus Heimdallarchaeota archaeon]